jgi:hypothetical protein
MQAEAKKNLCAGKAGSTNLFRSRGDRGIVKDTGDPTQGFAAFYARNPGSSLRKSRKKLEAKGAATIFSRSYMTAGYLGPALRALYTEVLPCCADSH